MASADAGLSAGGGRGHTDPFGRDVPAWTSRPHHPDEPACWSWSISDIVHDAESEAEAIFAWLSPEQRAARFGWRLFYEPVDLRIALRDAVRHRFMEFHDGRCALCGDRPGGHFPWWAVKNTRTLVEDHCHTTGQTRGVLCRGCNTREARTTNLRLERYRRWHPAAILGYYRWHWLLEIDQGWDSRHDWVSLGRRQPRPLTVWPARAAAARWRPGQPVM